MSWSSFLITAPQAGLGLLTTVVLMSEVAAQELAYPGFPLNPLPDDARCLGIGEACTAVAKGSQSITWNPAASGLEANATVHTQLRKAWLDAVVFDPEGLHPEALKASPGQLYKFISDDPTDVSRAGFNVPWGPMSLGAFYRKPLSYSGSTRVEYREAPVPHHGSYDLAVDQEEIGLNAAYRLSDSWTIGLSVLSASLSLSLDDRWQVGADAGSTSHTPVPIGTSSFADTVDGDDTDTIWHAGLIFDPDGPLSVGVSWRQGAEFSVSGMAVDRKSVDGSIIDSSLNGLYALSMPTEWSVGVGWQTDGGWLFSADFVHIDYSVLPPQRTHTLGLGLSTEGLTEPIDSGNSYRLGVEKPLCLDTLTHCMDLRLGVLTESDHDGIALVEGYDTQFTGGIGTAFGAVPRWVFDLAVFGGDEEIVLITGLQYRFHADGPVD